VKSSYERGINEHEDGVNARVTTEELKKKWVYHLLLIVWEYLRVQKYWLKCLSSETITLILFWTIYVNTYLFENCIFIHQTLLPNKLFFFNVINMIQCLYEFVLKSIIKDIMSYNYKSSLFVCLIWTNNSHYWV